jgi:hypothetical protein
MNFSPHSRSKTRNSFVALLLQPTLHNFCAPAPINHLVRITYAPNCKKSRKSNVALLLPLFVPVSPMLRYSYKKIGGGGYPGNSDLPIGAIPWNATREIGGPRESQTRLTSPISNSFRINRLSRFAGGPPHVSPLDSDSCRKQGWGVPPFVP